MTHLGAGKTFLKLNCIFSLGKVVYLTLSNSTAGFQALEEQYYNSWLHRYGL
jgi:hypothetical protein